MPHSCMLVRTAARGANAVYATHACVPSQPTAHWAGERSLIMVPELVGGEGHTWISAATRFSTHEINHRGQQSFRTGLATHTHKKAMAMEIWLAATVHEPVTPEMVGWCRCVCRPSINVHALSALVVPESMTRCRHVRSHRSKAPTGVSCVRLLIGRTQSRVDRSRAGCANRKAAWCTLNLTCVCVFCVMGA